MTFTELLQLNKREHLSVRKTNLLHPFFVFGWALLFLSMLLFLSFSTFWSSPAEQLMSP